jgi:hypothetical protein
MPFSQNLPKERDIEGFRKNHEYPAHPAQFHAEPSEIRRKTPIFVKTFTNFHHDEARVINSKHPEVVFSDQYQADMRAAAERSRQTRQDLEADRQSALQTFRDTATPLVDRLKSVIAGIPPEHEHEPRTLEFFRERLAGRTPGTKAHDGELGTALRRLGWVRKRNWHGTTSSGYASLWFPPEA